jgi:DNA-binding MarR family transcriptional regulator
MGSALDERIKQSSYQNEGQKALLNLIVAHDFVRQQMDALCEPFSITASQFNVLRILRGAHPEGYPRHEIGQRMLERAPDITRIIDRLEKQGLVERTKAESDRRLSLTRITSKGLTLLKHMDKTIEEMPRAFENKIGVRNCKRLSKICESIYARASSTTNTVLSHRKGNIK